MQTKYYISIVLLLIVASIFARLHRLRIKKRWKGHGDFGIRRVPTDRNRVSLTFDDGPHPDNTLKIIDVLKKYNVRASFFLVGKKARKYPEIVNYLFKENHDIGNHSYSHARLSFVSLSKMLKEIGKTQDVIKKITGKLPVFFRPPWGRFSKQQEDIVKHHFAFERKNIVLWDVCTYDWESPPIENLLETMEQNIKPGSIILLHDTSNTTAGHIEDIIIQLHKMRCEIVPLSELIHSTVPSSNKDSFTVVFASDDCGSLQLGISIFSLLESAEPNTRYRIYILEDNISPSNQEKILSLKQQFDTDVVFIPVEDVLGKFDGLEMGRWPRASLARLFISSKLPDEEIILYSDIDVLFCQDLHEIFETDMTDAVLGVVYEQNDRQAMAEQQTRLGMPPGSRYFNTGVLLMNLKEFRRRNGEGILMNHFIQHQKRLFCPDQDLLNAVFHNMAVRLHPKWNWTDGYSRRLLFKSVSKDNWNSGTVREVLEAADQPGILHFWGGQKPWRYNFRYEGERYRQVWLRSPWKDIPMKGKTLKLVFRKITMLPIYFLTKKRIKRLRNYLQRQDACNKE